MKVIRTETLLLPGGNNNASIGRCLFAVDSVFDFRVSVKFLRSRRSCVRVRLTSPRARQLWDAQLGSANLEQVFGAINLCENCSRASRVLGYVSIRESCQIRGRRQRRAGSPRVSTHPPPCPTSPTCHDDSFTVQNLSTKFCLAADGGVIRETKFELCLIMFSHRSRRQGARKQALLGENELEEKQRSLSLKRIRSVGEQHCTGVRA